MALTKVEIANSIADQLDYTKYRSSEIVEILLELIKKPLESGDDVLISGFGKSYSWINHNIINAQSGKGF